MIKTGQRFRLGNAIYRIESTPIRFKGKGKVRIIKEIACTAFENHRDERKSFEVDWPIRVNRFYTDFVLL